jgi:hypothetical protein
VPKVIWFSLIFELLFDEGKKAVKSMTPTPRSPQSAPIDEGYSRQCPRWRS